VTRHARWRLRAVRKSRSSRPRPAANFLRSKPKRRCSWRTLNSQPRHDKRRAYAERALALRRELSHPSSPWLAEAHLALADAQLASGETRARGDNVARARVALSAQGEVGDQFRQPLLALARRTSN